MKDLYSSLATYFDLLKEDTVNPHDIAKARSAIITVAGKRSKQGFCPESSFWLGYFGLTQDPIIKEAATCSEQNNEPEKQTPCTKSPMAFFKAAYSGKAWEEPPCNIVMFPNASGQ